MIAVPFTPVTSTDVLVSINAVDEPTWSSGTTYALSDAVSKNQRRYVSLQAANTGHDPEEVSSLWWRDVGPSNRWAMFDTSVQTPTTRAGGLEWTLKTGRVTSIGLMGVSGATAATITIRDGLDGPVIDTFTKAMASSNGTYYGFCFEHVQYLSDAFFYGLRGSINGHITVTLTGSGDVSCGLCVFGRQVYVGQAEFGFNFPIQSRGRQYLDRLGNPVSVERGHSKSCTGTVVLEKNEFNRLMKFGAEHVDIPCLWIAAPGISDWSAGSVFGKFSRLVPAIPGPTRTTALLEIDGFR